MMCKGQGQVHIDILQMKGNRITFTLYCYLGGRGVTFHQFTSFYGGLDALYDLSKFPDNPDLFGQFPSFSPKSAFEYVIVIQYIIYTYCS